ncbi:MAG TPA: peptidylprolyl isomerase [Gemmatimonadaceae bacterium]|nr:peptidylprolyl isomerase [Gemmatimonadaceae bacterium]
MRYISAILALAALGACNDKGAPQPHSGTGASAPSAALVSPNTATLAAPGPDSFTARFTTSRGLFDVKVHRDWAPLGADRFYHLVDAGFYDGVRFYRVIAGFVAQFGSHGDPAVEQVWHDLRIADDPVRHRNERGTVTFATAGPDTRTTQLFINVADNSRLDKIGFAPMGEVVNGMSVVDSFYNGYGEGAPGGQGPDQGRLAREGNAYLTAQFPKLDYIVSARVFEEW